MKKRILAALLIATLLLAACGAIVVDDLSETVLSGIGFGAALAEGNDDHSDADIQKRLIELGFLNGKADGIFGPRSREALSAFQTWCGLEPTGERDDATLSLLFGDPAALPTPEPTPLAKGAKDVEGVSDVSDIQARLIALNYLSGSADGIFGNATSKALIAFQELNGLEPTGIADDATIKALNAEAALPMPTPEPTPRVRGAKGEDIRRVQEALRIMGFMSGNADGDLGPETEKAIKRYQQYVHDRREAFYSEHPEVTPEPTPSPEPASSVKPASSADNASSAEPTSSDGTESSPNPASSAEIGSSAKPSSTLIPSEIPDVTAGVVLITPDPIDMEQPSVDDTKYEPDGELTDELMADILAFNDVVLYQEDLAKGARGDEVTRLQRRLASLWYLSASTDIDGRFGGNTESALKYFQKRNSLDETGLADKELQLLLYSADAVKCDRPTHPYKLKISVDDQRVYAYKWVNGEYTALERTMICSTGTKENPTPYGTFSAGGACGRWYYFEKFDCWAQYAYRINGGILFHSVLYSEKDEKTLRQSSVKNLGTRASHGCIRLKVEDAKWIYNNCPAGTSVTVY